jgi:hypothetical protein
MNVSEGSADVNIEFKTIAGKECLFFKFGEHLTDLAAKTAVVKWKNEFNKYPEKKIRLVWECLEMKGYDKEARTIWQGMMSEYKNRIDCIYVITRSSLISAGAHFMGIFVGIKMTGITSITDLERQLALNKNG